MVRALCAISAEIAGWRWLLSETVGNPAPHIFEVVTVNVVIIVGTLMSFCLQFILQLLGQQVRQVTRS